MRGFSRPIRRANGTFALQFPAVIPDTSLYYFSVNFHMSIISRT